MNYFEFFGLKPCFQIDPAELKRRFLENSMKYHPDFHGLHSDEDQDKALETSTINNRAYKILSGEFSRIAYILEMEQMMPEEGKAEVPQEFLMEMMELNEKRMELEFEENPEGGKQELREEIERISAGLKEDAIQHMRAWDANPLDKDSLVPIRDYLMKSRYLQRLKNGLI